MKHSEYGPRKLDVFGDSMLNKLKGETRKRRKRDASKKRRVKLKALLPKDQSE